MKLSQSTVENLGYYVYLLINPRSNKPFYVGKGRGDRINQHVLGALSYELEETVKVKTIREIEGSGFEVNHIILRHGLTEKEAFEVESAVIDVLGIKNLTNLVSGHYASERGSMNLRDIAIKYQAKDAEFVHSALLININKLYHPEMNSEELYEATRKHWKLNLERVEGIEVVCAVFAGIVREVFVPETWNNSTGEHTGRLNFEGQIAPDEIRKKYIDKLVAKYWPRGGQNPIKYID